VPPLSALAAVSIGVLLCAGIAAERLSLRDVLRRAGEYVVGYGDALERVVADERYTQELLARPGGTVIRSRVIRAEIAFVRLAGSREWQAFRNAIEVDGTPLPGADGRLDRLFREAPSSIIGQARALAEASARHNLGPLRRDFNAPTMPLQFLHPSHQDRFRFDKRHEESIGTARVWVVRFRERARATLIRSPEGRDVPVEGQFWIAPGTGSVMRASFFARDFLPAESGPQEGADARHDVPWTHAGRAARPNKDSRADVDVAWQHDTKLDLHVPVEMRERYSGPWTEDGTGFDITGTAVYSNYRRFDVDVRIIGSAGTRGGQ
jgi:hypothetical protein